MSANPMVVVELMAYDNTIKDYHFATPAEVAAAHPTCGTCRFYGFNSSLRVKPCNACTNPRSPYFVVADDIIDPALDYCRFHSELNQTKEPR